jgi:DNA-binding response OmpR family regulator
MAGTILIIDDSLTLLQRVKTHLSTEHYEVYTATTYPDARPLLNRADLVVIDFHMPGQDGPSMLRALRAAATNLPSPPLMYLHTTDSEQAANYKQLGFDGVIGMKGNFELLTKQVNAAMRLRRLSVKIRIG